MRYEFLLKRRESWEGEMGSVPQGMFAALKVHQHLLEEEKEESPKITDKTFRSTTYSYGVDTLPQRYSSKLMMSIWNLYNKYSPHNVKQHTEKLTASPSSGSLHLLGALGKF